MDAWLRAHESPQGPVTPDRAPSAEGRNRILEELARGASVDGVLALIVDTVESELPGDVVLDPPRVG